MIDLNWLSRHLEDKKTLIVAAAMVAFAGLNSAAVANQISGDIRARTISLADLDLSTVEGQRAARERLHGVARRLCSQVADELDLSHQTNYLACIDMAMAQAERRLQASRGDADLLARK
jgi:UrcA family protein